MRAIQSTTPYSAITHHTIPCCIIQFPATPYSAIPYPTLSHHTTHSCDGCSPPVWSHRTLVQAGAQQAGLTKVTPVVWAVSESTAPRPKKAVWLEICLVKHWNCMNPAENLTTNQPLDALSICSHQSPLSSPSIAAGCVAVISPGSPKVTPRGWEVPDLTPDTGGSVSDILCTHVTFKTHLVSLRNSRCIPYCSQCSRW